MAMPQKPNKAPEPRPWLILNVGKNGIDRMKMNFLCTVVCVTLLAGCSSVPKFENKQQAGDAVIRCENGGFGSMMSADAFVSIKEIDGAETDFVKKGAIYHLHAGKHELALLVSTITMKEARQYLEFEAIADRKYRLTAVRKDRDFIVELVDETDHKAVKPITSLKMRASSANILPILIPVK